MKLENKSVIVTGSGRGIGEYIAKRLAREGANVIVTGRTVRDIENVSKEINDAGGRSIFIKGDIKIEKDVKEVIHKTIKEFGKFAGIGLTESAALEVNNVKIVVLCPGSVDTGMFRRLFPGEKADLKPEEVAEKVADICMHTGKYRQGQSIEIYRSMILALV